MVTNMIECEIVHQENNIEDNRERILENIFDELQLRSDEDIEVSLNEINFE